MSSLRRILAVGLPAAGVTALTALALSGAPTMAATNDMVVQPMMAATDEPTRGNAGYATPDETPEVPAGEEPTAEPTTDAPTRGNPGYGTPSPTTPAPTPSASTDTVPPGVSPSSEAPSPVSETPGGGVKAGHALPVTGAPTGAIISVGGLMVAAGAASIWYTRKRRTA